MVRVFCNSTLVLRRLKGDSCIWKRRLHCLSWSIAAYGECDSPGFRVVLIQVPAVNKTGAGSFDRLRRGVMVRMRSVESPLKVQWRVVVGIEGCIQRRLRIPTSLDSVDVFGDVRVLLIYLLDLLILCKLWMSPH
ncbi:Uncharacterized protein Rs2_18328 [Raphanus sativus]|nr:Uncharacterized protein Rs2_18328 [Raphanus sativus]